MQRLSDDIKIAFSQIKRWFWAVLFVLPASYILSGFYSVGIDQRAFVTRFGKLTVDNITSGMHYRLPWPFESATISDIPSLKSMVVEFSANEPKLKSTELITGDGNLIDSRVEIQYSVSETMKFSTSTVNSDKILADLAKSEVIYHISYNKFESLLTTGRNQFQERIKLSLQQAADNLALGIRITGIQIKLLEPPKSIKKAFDDVSSAQSEKQKMIQEARGERGAKLAKARSEANREKSNARARSNELIKKAEGDMERFASQIHAMKTDKAFLKRTYMDSLEAIFNRSQVSVISAE